MRSFAAAIFLLIALCFAVPVAPASATDMQADQQCPAGGSVGDPCKDTTNGYVTQGHCEYINWCKADKYKQSPPKGSDSSSGSSVSSGPTQIPASAQVQAGSFATDYSQQYPKIQSSFYVQLQNMTPQNVVQTAYVLGSPTVSQADAPPGGNSGTQVVGQTGTPAQNQSNDGLVPYFHYLDFQGTTYLVAPDAIQELGAPLRYASDTPPVPLYFDTDAFKAMASISLPGVSANTNVSGGYAAGSVSGSYFSQGAESSVGTSGGQGSALSEASAELYGFFQNLTFGGQGYDTEATGGTQDQGIDGPNTSRGISSYLNSTTTAWELIMANLNVVLLLCSALFAGILFLLVRFGGKGQDVPETPNKGSVDV